MAAFLLSDWAIGSLGDWKSSDRKPKCWRSGIFNHAITRRPNRSIFRLAHQDNVGIGMSLHQRQLAAIEGPVEVPEVFRLE
jgi:hypothetical protein